MVDEHQTRRPHEERTIVTKYTTGLPVGKFADLLIRLREEGVEGYPPSLGLRGSLKAALIYMRHNEPFSPGFVSGIVPEGDDDEGGGHDRGDGGGAWGDSLQGP